MLVICLLPKLDRLFFQGMEKKALHQDYFDPSLVFLLYFCIFLSCFLFFSFFLFAKQEAEHNYPEIWMQIGRNP